MARTALLACVLVVLTALASSEADVTTETFNDATSFNELDVTSGTSRPASGSLANAMALGVSEFVQQRLNADYKYLHRTKLTPGEKRATQSNAFKADVSSEKLHAKAEKEENIVEAEQQREFKKGRAFHHGGLDKKLTKAITRCNALKKLTFWNCNRWTCKYHKKCSGKFQKNECKVELKEHKDAEKKRKHHEKWQKKYAVVHEKKIKKLRKEHAGHELKEKAKEVTWKSNAPERKKKKIANEKEKKAKEQVQKKYMKEIDSWGKKDLELMEAKVTDTLAGKRVLNAMKEMKKLSVKHEKDMKERKKKNKIHNSKSCKSQSQRVYTKCRTDTKKAYNTCFSILKQASDFFHNDKKAKRSLKGFGVKHHHKKAMRKHKVKHLIKHLLRAHFRKKGKRKGKHGHKGKRAGKPRKNIKHALKKLHKIVKAVAQKATQNPQVLKDKKKAKKLGMKASQALAKAQAMTEAKNYRAATYFGKIAVKLSGKKIGAKAKVAKDEEKAAVKASLGKKGKKSKKKSKKGKMMASLYQQQARLYKDNLTPQSLYAMEEDMYQESLEY